MTERRPTSPTPQELLQLKDDIRERFNQLPPEHQATLSLVLLDRVLLSVMGQWIREALEIRGLPPLPESEAAAPGVRVSVTVTREHLERLFFSRRDRDSLSEDDLRQIGANIEASLMQGFWDELEYATDMLLLKKRGLEPPVP